MRNLYSFSIVVFEEVEMKEEEYFGFVIACSYAEALDKLAKDFGEDSLVKVNIEVTADACNDTIVFCNKNLFLESIEDILR